MRFTSYGELLDLVEEIFIYEVYKSAPVSGVIIDCGANIGLSVIYFRKNFPTARIVAFEPSATEFKILRDNIDYNKIENIQLFNFALGDKEGTAHLVSSGDGSASLTHRTFFTHHSSDGPIVSVRRLSEYIESKIALLKIDIEGAEVSVLRELQQSSKIKLISQIVVEFHHDNADIPLEEFVEILVSNGFLCRQEHDRRHPNTAFSIVYATRKLI